MILIYFLFSDEAREKQIPPNDQLQNGSPTCISTGGTESNTGFQSSETQSMVFIRTNKVNLVLNKRIFAILENEKTRK